MGMILNLIDNLEAPLFECAHDWVSQGNVNTNGIIKYFEAYYT